MTRMKAIFALAVVFLPVVSHPLFGQDCAESDLRAFKDAEKKNGIDTTFCTKNAGPTIKRFCRTLSLVQDFANYFSSKNQDAPIKCLESVGGTLDLTGKNGVQNFITGTATDFALRAAVADALSQAGQSRLDRQQSAGSNASGTTSLVSKAGSAELLSLALDTGILTQSVNGTTATFTTNADQVFRLITGNDPDCTVLCSSKGAFANFQSAVLSHVNASVTVDLAQQNNTTVPTTGQASGTTPTPVTNATIPTGAGKVSQAAVRYQLLNRFDPRSQKFKDAWAAQMTTLSKPAEVTQQDTDKVQAALNSHSPWSGKQAAASDAEKKALADSDQRFEGVLEAAKSDPKGTKLLKTFSDYWNSLVTPEVLQDANLGAAVSQVAKDRAAYRQAWFQAVETAVGSLATFEYDYNHPLNQPYTNDFKIIFAYSYANMGMLTFNGAFSLYGTIPVGAKYQRLHYGQVSAEYDRTMTGQGKGLQTQLSLAGYWQYQPDPSVLNIPAGTVAPGTNIPVPNGTQEFVSTAGSLWVAQGKLTIKGAGGINVPIGVSWSNKTDLLQGSRVGAQVGISYNFTSLAGLFSGGSQ